MARAGLGTPWGFDTPPNTHVCTQAAPRHPKCGPGPLQLRQPEHKSPHGHCQPWGACGTSCGAANSSELTQRRGRIAKPPEMTPKQKKKLKKKSLSHCAPAGPVTGTPGQKPPAGWGGGSAGSHNRRSRRLHRGKSRSVQAAPRLHPDGCKPGGLWPPKNHPWPRGNQSLVPQVPTAGAQPRGGTRCRGSPGVRAGVCPSHSPRCCREAASCQEELVERLKSHRLPGKLGRPEPGSAGRQRWAEAVSHLGAISALPPLAAFPPKLFLHGVITGAGGRAGRLPRP